MTSYSQFFKRVLLFAWAQLTLYLVLSYMYPSFPASWSTRKSNLTPHVYAVIDFVCGQLLGIKPTQALFVPMLLFGLVLVPTLVYASADVLTTKLMCSPPLWTRLTAAMAIIALALFFQGPMYAI